MRVLYEDDWTLIDRLLTGDFPSIKWFSCLMAYSIIHGQWQKIEYAKKRKCPPTHPNFFKVAY